MKGKEKCEILKAIRKELAEQNNINIQFDECTHSGDCKGTCPKCDAELRYIDDELKKRAKRKETVIIPMADDKAGNNTVGSHLWKNHFDIKELNPIKKIKEMIDTVLNDEYLGGEIYMPNRSDPSSQKADHRVIIGIDNLTPYTYEEIENIRNGTLDMLGLSEMSYNCMKAAGKNTVRDILAMTEEELEALKATNTSCYDDIVYKVNLRRLEFDYEKRNK